MAEQSRPARRLWLYLPFIIAGVVLLAYYFLWRAGADEMKKGVEAWVADQRAAGLDVSHSGVEPDGFPFFLRVHIDDPDIAQPGAWRWRTKRLTLDALPYDLNRLIFSTRSEQQIWTERYGQWTVTAEDFRTSIANDDARSWIFAATVGNARATGSNGGETLALESLVFDLAPDAAEPAKLTLNLAAAGLSTENGEAALELYNLQTILSVSQTHAFSANDPASAWRHAGGEIIITGLLAQIGDARLSVSGALRLDENNRPEGRLDTEIIAPAAFAHALGATGVLTAGEAQSAAAALTLTAIAGGGKITTPIVLENGAAHIAGAKLFDLDTAD